MSEKPNLFYEFGPFRVDDAERQLLRDGEEIELTPKAFGVLLVLVRNQGRVVGKEDFMREVWPDSVVEDKNITDNISILRQALGDDAREPRYIKTVPRRGYRFVGEVTEMRDGGIDLIVAEHTRAHILVEEEDEKSNVIGQTGELSANESTALSASLRATPKAERKLRPAVLAVVALVLGGTLVAAIFYLRATRPQPAAAIKSIAVLPFKPLVANERDESLEMGMADTLITRLSSISRITVRPFSAARKYTKLEDEAARAGQELMVDAVLDGNIQKAGDRVRVSVRLVRVEQGQTLWAEQFDEKFTNIFAVQDAISRRVGDMLALRLSGEEKERLAKRGTDNPEAYQAYLLGRFHWSKRTGGDVRKSIEYFNQAIARDPNYALAYAGLADSYIVLPTLSNTLSGEANIKGGEAALKALALDDTIAEAHASLAAIKELYEWDFAGAEREFKRAIELNPNYTTAHIWYAQFLSSLGRPAEAIAQAERAQEVDPTSLPTNVALGNMYLDAHQPDAAIVQLQRTIEMDKSFALAHLTLAGAYLAKEMYEDAIAELRKSMVLSGRNSPEEAARKANMLEDGYQKSGAKGFWEKMLELRIENMKRGYTVSPTAMAAAYARTGDKDRAFEWLEKAYAERDHYLFYNLKAGYNFDGIRSDPRYANLLQRIGLPQ